MTGPVFRAVLPLPPSVNASLRPAVIGWKGGKPIIRLVKTREAEAFEEECRAELRRLQPQLALHRGVLALRVTFYAPTLASDVGNREKLLADACKGLAMHDDRQIAEVRLLRRVDA
ncbi:MAG TPA: RusA family crossover junction endodeoxyribonuclease, partial [Archangium sp.]|nr:RusA family crossover junction endodeoxyribonuclease [Archangium sp.]